MSSPNALRSPVRHAERRSAPGHASGSPSSAARCTARSRGRRRPEECVPPSPASRRSPPVSLRTPFGRSGNGVALAWHSGWSVGRRRRSLCRCCLRSRLGCRQGKGRSSARSAGNVGRHRGWARGARPPRRPRAPRSRGLSEPAVRVARPTSETHTESRTTRAPRSSSASGMCARVPAGLRRLVASLARVDVSGWRAACVDHRSPHGRGQDDDPWFFAEAYDAGVLDRTLVADSNPLGRRGAQRGIGTAPGLTSVPHLATGTAAARARSPYPRVATQTEAGDAYTKGGI